MHCNIEARSRIIVAVEKQRVLLIGLWVRPCACVMWVPGRVACACAYVYVHVVLVIQDAMRMCHIVTSFMAPRSLIYFSTLCHKRCDFRKKKLSNIKCVF